MEFVPDHGAYLRLWDAPPRRLIWQMLETLRPDEQARLDEGLQLVRPGLPPMTVDSIVSRAPGLTEVLIESPIPELLDGASQTAWSHVWRDGDTRRSLMHDGRLRYVEERAPDGSWTVRLDEEQVRSASFTPAIQEFIARALRSLQEDLGQAAIVLDGVSDRALDPDVGQDDRDVQATAHEERLRTEAIRFDFVELGDEDIPF